MTRTSGWARPLLTALTLAAVVAGVVVGYRTSFYFTTPICPMDGPGPHCLVGGSSNSTAFYLWWAVGGGAVALALVIAILATGRDVLRRSHRGKALDDIA